MRKQLKATLVAMLFAGTVLAGNGVPALSITDYQIVPKPLQMSYVQGDEGFRLSNGTAVVYPEGNAAMRRNAEFLAQYMATQMGITLKVVAGKPQAGSVNLLLGTPSDNAEAYTLTVKDGRVDIAGETEAGVFYGIQTLRKMVGASRCPQVQLSAVSITDEPRFGYRGMHLDVCRHFFTVEEVKQYIDILALHNVNRLHWHLTEDQGWRLEIKKYPELTEKGSVRKETIVGKYGSGQYDNTPYGGYYTQEQVKKIVDYAAKQYITIIPEIDLPGHMVAALHTYPELGCTGGPYDVRTTWGVAEEVLCAGNPKTMEFLIDVLNEVADIFPSEYIHIGGDECPKKSWEACSRCQAFIKKLKLKTDKEHTKEERLQSYIISSVQKALEKRGRKIIGWTEILEGGLAPGATLMSWLGEKGGIQAAKMGNDVIMTPNGVLYFDFYQTPNPTTEPLAIGGYSPLENVYHYEPVPASLTAQEAKHVIGVQANVWTEYIKSFSHVQIMLLPRLAALSEVQWGQKGDRDFTAFMKRLSAILPVYEHNKWHYSPSAYSARAFITPAGESGAYNVSCIALPGAKIYYTTDGSVPTTKSTLYTAPFTVSGSGAVNVLAVYPALHSTVHTYKFGQRK